jgi:TetR/AcrR family transcriptional regulator, mexJK operon transcriptional repressor
MKKQVKRTAAKPAARGKKPPPTTRARRADLRREDIVRQVAPLFLQRGYDGVSLNEIIDLVGGSKTTIYSFFGGKDGLLDAVVRYMTAEVTFGIDTKGGGTLESQLTRIGLSFLKLVLNPDVLAFHRLMVSMGRSFPAAGQLFFESGPVMAAKIVAGWIETHQQAGRLMAGDPQRMAQLFLDMLIGEHQLGWLTSRPDAAEPARVEETVRLAVKIFLNGAATGRGPANGETARRGPHSRYHSPIGSTRSRPSRGRPT